MISLFRPGRNKQLNEKITRIADFYKAQKNIAKILETQYEYSFLLPVIGEILDNFAKDYFAYICILWLKDS